MRDKPGRPETSTSPTTTEYSASKDGMSLKVKRAIVHLPTSQLWLTDFPCSEKGVIKQLLIPSLQQSVEKFKPKGTLKNSRACGER